MGQLNATWRPWVSFLSLVIANAWSRSCVSCSLMGASPTSSSTRVGRAPVGRVLLGERGRRLRHPGLKDQCPELVIGGVGEVHLQTEETAPGILAAHQSRSFRVAGCVRLCGLLSEAKDHSSLVAAHSEECFSAHLPQGNTVAEMPLLGHLRECDRPLADHAGGDRIRPIVALSAGLAAHLVDHRRKSRSGTCRHHRRLQGRSRQSRQTAVRDGPDVLTSLSERRLAVLWVARASVRQ